MISAQDRLAPSLGLSNAELERVQTEMKFAASENLVRHGFRYEAARLFVENIRGARSVADVFRTALRLAIPQTLFQWNRRRKRENTRKRYGKLEDVLQTERGD